MATQTVYTYRAGKKIPLDKKDNEFIARILPVKSIALGFDTGEQVSSHSTRLFVPPGQLDEAMKQVRTIAPAHHAYYFKDTPNEFLITDRILVTFKNPATNAELDTFRANHALTQLAKYSDTEYLFQLTNHTGINPVKLVVELNEKEPLVAFADHDLNQRVTARNLLPPTDPVYARQWHLHTHPTPPPPPTECDIRSSSRCEEAWQLLDTFGSPDVVVALSDDGCRLTHGDFDSVGKFAAWGYMRGTRLVTYADVDAQPSQMYLPGSDHGTSCAGVIAGEVDGILTVGAAPGCRLLPIQWESSGPSLFISDSKLLTVLQYIQDKADVFSNSWGGGPISTWSLPVLNKISQLTVSGGRRGKGIVFLWAAGNENCPIQYEANQEVPYDHGVAIQGGALVWVGVSTTRSFQNNLVGLPGVMHIAALASTAQRSHYSNYGPGISLCASSSNSHSYYRMTVQGLGISTTTGETINVTDDFGGTSSATPLVAGIAALVISANANLTAQEVISVLQQTASKDLNMKPYGKTPPASFDPDTSWDVSPVAPFDKGTFSNTGSPDGSWSPWFGHGKVDACEAVRKALLLKLQNGHTTPLQIASALVDPSGKDKGAETVTLRNPSGTAIQVDGWALSNGKNKKQPLSGTVAPGQSTIVPLKSSQLQLTNTGGTIALLDAQGNEIHKVKYTAAQVKSGKELKF